MQKLLTITKSSLLWIAALPIKAVIYVIYQFPYDLINKKWPVLMLLSLDIVGIILGLWHYIE